MTTPATAAPLRVKTIVWPTVEPISIEDCRSHLEAPVYGDSDVDPVDNVMILAFLSAAREYCENFTGLFIARRTVEVALDAFPTGAIELPFAPLVAVLSVTSAEGSDGEVEDTVYTVDDYSKPARLVPVSAWPTVTEATNTIKIRCEVGYSDDSDGPPLPYALRAAMLLVLGHLYANREDSTDKAMETLPNGADSLMRPLRIRLGMA